MGFLDGNKTYIVGAAVGVIAALKYLGFIPAAIADTALTILMGGGLATLRSAIKK